MNRLNVIKKYVDFMIKIAKDDKHGYSQIRRWGNDYDCSSLVITALKYAGIDTKKASYTGNMYENLKHSFKNLGSVNVEHQQLFKTNNLEVGDILLNDKHHVAVYIGNCQIAHARFDEKGGIKGEQQGDQTGEEIAITQYYDYKYGWDKVLRLKEDQREVRNSNFDLNREEIVINEDVFTVDVIKHNDYNYIKIRDLEDIFYKVDYNKSNKKIILKSL